MNEGDTLTVTESELGRFPVGTELNVQRHHVNQFTDRETITIKTDEWGDVKTFAQFYRIDGDEWREIVVGTESDTVTVE